MPEKKAFVIMSFDQKYDNVFERSIRPAFEDSGYICKRADRSLGTENIPRRVIQDIIDADIVLADLSENSPNVFYELGVSHSVGNKTLIIISDDAEIPFDIASYRTRKYSNTRDRLELLKYQLKDEIKNFNKKNITNLVQEAGRDYFDLRGKIENRLRSLNAEIKRTKKFNEYIKEHFFKDENKVDNSRVAKRIGDHVEKIIDSDTNRSVIISICGSGAIGKSSFASVVKEHIKGKFNCKVSILATDSYMLSRVDRIEKDLLGFDVRANDLKQFKNDVENLLNNREIKISPYNHETGEHEEETIVKPGKVIILEGIYSFFPGIDNLCKNRNVEQLKYFIYADKYKAKELKFISDIKERGHSIHKALQHAVPEYSAYETYILPHIKLANYIINVDGYWKYELPEFQNVYDLYPDK